MPGDVALRVTTTNRILRWSGPLMATAFRRYAVDVIDDARSIGMQAGPRDAHPIVRERTRDGATDR